MSDFINALHVQTRVVHAFILRETRTRFGRSKLGYLWAFFEPMAYIVSLLAIFSVLDRSAPINTSLPLFFLTGIMPWLLFSRTLSAVFSSIESNAPLLTYPQVKILDIVLARVILEFSTLFLVAFIYVLLLFYANELGQIESLLGVVIVLLISSLSGASIGLLGGVVKMYMPAYGAFQSILVRFLFFTSGIYFVADSLPSVVVEWLWFNPVLHLIEWMRSVFFLNFESNFLDRIYPIVFLLVSLFFSLMFERVAQYKLRQIGL